MEKIHVQNKARNVSADWISLNSRPMRKTLKISQINKDSRARLSVGCNIPLLFKNIPFYKVPATDLWEFFQNFSGCTSNLLHLTALCFRIFFRKKIFETFNNIFCFVLRNKCIFQIGYWFSKSRFDMKVHQPINNYRYFKLE